MIGTRVGSLPLITPRRRRWARFIHTRSVPPPALGVFTAAEQRLRVRLARPTDPIPIAAESLRFRRSPGEPERRFIPFRRFKTPLLTGLLGQAVSPYTLRKYGAPGCLV